MLFLCVILERKRRIPGFRKRMHKKIERENPSWLELSVESDKKIGSPFELARDAFASFGMTARKRRSIASPFENTQGRLRSFDSSSFRSG